MPKTKPKTGVSAAALKRTGIVSAFIASVGDTISAEEASAVIQGYFRDILSLARATQTQVMAGTLADKYAAIIVEKCEQALDKEG